MAIGTRIIATLLLIGGCGAPEERQDVEARLRHVGRGVYALTVINHTARDACFPALFPSDGESIGFIVFDDTGVARQGAVYEPARESVPAHRLAAHSRQRIEVEFPQGVADEDCVLLELVHKDCAEQDHFSAVEGIENPRLLQVAWVIEQGQPRTQPDVEHSCVPANHLERTAGLR